MVFVLVGTFLLNVVAGEIQAREILWLWTLTDCLKFKKETLVLFAPKTSIERNVSIAVVMYPLMNSVDWKWQTTCDPCSLGEAGRQVVAWVSHGGMIKCWVFKEPGLVGMGRESGAWNMPALAYLKPSVCISPVNHIWWGRPDWCQRGRIQHQKCQQQFHGKILRHTFFQDCFSFSLEHGMK